jgi:hypothetical protein
VIIAENAKIIADLQDQMKEEKGANALQSDNESSI